MNSREITMAFRSLLVVLTFLAAAPAAAQVADGPAPGDRLRVHAPGWLGERQLVGRFMGRDSVALLLSPRYAPRARVPLASIERLERSRGPRRGVRTLLGALAGLAVSTAAVAASDPGSWECGSEFCGLGQSILIVGGSTIAGGILGYTTYRERWTEVPVPD
jgi:hypothetical protein